MAGADKILVVVILVLSCVFLYAAVSVFGGEQKDREENKGLRDEIDRLNNEIEDLKEAGEAGAYTRIEETIKGLSDVTTGLSDVKDSLKVVEDKVHNTDQSAETRSGKLSAYIKTLEGTISAHSATIKALTEELNTINKKIHEQTEQINNLDAKNRDLQANIDKSEERHKEELRKKDKEIEDLKGRIAGPGADGTGSGTPPPPPPPDVVCEILNVVRDGETTMVLLDKGSKDRLRVGHELFVYNAVERYRGIIRVYKMEGDDRCIATIVKEAVGKKIAANDKAAVKTWTTE